MPMAWTGPCLALVSWRPNTARPSGLQPTAGRRAHDACFSGGEKPAERSIQCLAILHRSVHYTARNNMASIQLTALPARKEDA